MIIPHAFDVSNEERKKIAERQALRTAQNLNNRVRLFIVDLEQNSYLTHTQKNKIRQTLMENL